MTNLLDASTRLIVSKLHILGYPSPRVAIVRALVETAFLASLRTEEGRFVRGSLTFANPREPEVDPPINRRADYPDFAVFGHPMRLTPESLAKLSRGIDQWSGSIAVYGTKASDLIAWGVVDQIVHANVRRYREAAEGGAGNPGLLTITVDAPGVLSVYHQDLFLVGLRQDELIVRELPALRSGLITGRIARVMTPVALQIASALGTRTEWRRILDSLSTEWSRTLERLCIGLRRLGTGGAFLITPRPFDRLLDVTYAFPYPRLSDAVILGILDASYLDRYRRQVFDRGSDMIAPEVLREFAFAEADSQDRDLELTGAVRLVTSLASIDGLVLLTPILGVRGFGVKIKAGPPIGTLYDGAKLSRRGGRVTVIDSSRYGMRHGSVFRYCRADGRAIGVVVSQDGQVRLVMTAKRRLALWEGVQLLDYEHDVRRYALQSRRARAYRDAHRKYAGLGYTSMPKTLSELSQVKIR